MIFFIMMSLLAYSNDSKAISRYAICRKFLINLHIILRWMDFYGWSGYIIKLIIIPCAVMVGY